jgi:hypothetical protein
MDILDEVVGSPEENVSLDSLVGNQAPSLLPPRNAVRNRAATTAMLTDQPEKLVDNYTLMMQESEQGQDLLGDQLRQNILQKTQQVDMKGVMSILADPAVPLDQKRNAIESIKQSQLLKDQGMTLYTNAAQKESRGETLEAEDARLSSVEAIAEIYRSKNDVQGLVNAHAASLPDVSPEIAAKMAELYVMPFGNSVNVAKLKAAQGGNWWQVIKSFALPGSATADMREQLETIPPDQRVAFAKSLIETISNNSGVVFSSDNQFAQYDKAVSIFEEGGYSGFQEFVDNVSPLLDVVGIGQVMRGGAKAAKSGAKTEAAAGRSFSERVQAADWELVDDRPRAPQARRIESNIPKLTYQEDIIKRIELNSPVHRENPAAPANVIQQANPQQARDIHSTVVKSGTDEVAEGLYGTSKEQAIANDIYPQVDSGSGRVTSKPIDIGRNLRQELQVPDELIDLINNSGATYYTKGEKAAARANIVNDFGNAQGMAINESMSSFKLDGGRVVVSAVYGTPEGAFTNAVDAFRQARLALRQYGVLDSEITVLRKEGYDHVPIGLNDEVPDGPGNYLVRVDTSHEFDPTDFSKLETMDVKRNFFDRIPQIVGKNNGSVTRNLFDAASTLHPVYTGAASVASDASARFERVMLGYADEYAKKFVKFDDVRKNKMDEYIREANFNELDLDITDLTARGFNADEVDALRSWRKFWDSHYYLENLDVVRSLNSQGFQVFKNQTTELYAKPIAKNQNIGGVYDPATSSVVYHSKSDGDTLYNSGGTYAKLRRPSNFGGDVTEYMIVRNSPTEYLRKIRDTDSVLNYRKGYYQLQYKAPKFVDEVQLDGTVKTVAVAGDTVEANHFAKRMKTTTGLEYRVRGDDKAIRRGDDSWWDLNSASGRIAQRHRGKLLEDSSGLNHLGGSDYIVNPVDSATRAARSIAGRTVNRPMLEAAKARFMAQYDEYLPTNGMGGKRYPSSVKELGAKGEHVSSNLADARTTYEYINYLENGYINAIDDIFKAGLNSIAEMLGKGGFGKLERGAEALGSMAPTSLAKNGVFMAYIGSNVFRQLIVQPHQIVRTFSYNPVGWGSGAVPKLMAEFISEKMGSIFGGTSKSAFSKFVEESGFLDAVDKTNLVRGTLTDAADSSNKVLRVVGKGNNVLRKIGFDTGENANMLGHAAAVYDRYSRLGRNLSDKAVRDEAYAEIRAISYDMNFAGDMPYNQTAPAVLLQFMQVPHKAFLQMTNRKIPVADRAKLVAGDLILWGAPVATIGAIIGADILPDNPELRETFLWGVESYLINAALSQLMEERVNIDLSSLAPYDLTGWGKFFTAMAEGGLHDLLLNSPAGQMFFKDGSRSQQAIKAMGRYFGMVQDDDETPETFLSVMHEVAKMSSGYSNAYKAKLMLDAKKRYDQYGSTIDSNVNSVEAWAQALGFGTGDTRDLYRISMEMTKDTKKHKEEVIRVYNDIKRYYTEKLDSENNSPEFITKVTGRMLRVFKDDPVAIGIISQQLSQDLAGKDSQLIATFLRRSGIPELTGVRDQVKQMPVSEDQKTLMLQRLDDMEKARKQMEKDK